MRNARCSGTTGATLALTSFFLLPRMPEERVRKRRAPPPVFSGSGTGVAVVTEARRVIYDIRPEKPKRKAVDVEAAELKQLGPNRAGHGLASTGLGGFTHRPAGGSQRRTSKCVTALDSWRVDEIVVQSEDGYRPFHDIYFARAIAATFNLPRRRNTEAPYRSLLHFQRYADGSWLPDGVMQCADPDRQHGVDEQCRRCLIGTAWRDGEHAPRGYWGGMEGRRSPVMRLPGPRAGAEQRTHATVVRSGTYKARKRCTNLSLDWDAKAKAIALRDVRHMSALRKEDVHRGMFGAFPPSELDLCAFYREYTGAAVMGKGH